MNTQPILTRFLLAPPKGLKSRDLPRYLNESLKNYIVSLFRVFILLSFFFASTTLFAQSDLEKEAYSSFKAKDYSKAVDLFAKLIKENTSNAVYYKDLGVCLSKLRDYTNAIQSLEKAKQIDASLADVYPPLALAYIKTKQIDKGVLAFETYAKSPDASPSILAFSYRSLGDIFLKQNKSAKAVESYSKSADYFFNTKEYASSAEVYQSIIDIKPSADLYAKQGKAYAKAFDTENASGSFENAIKLDPNNIDYQKYLAQSYYIGRQFEKAADQYMILIDADPSNRDSHTAKMVSSLRQQGEHYVQKKEFAKALQQYDLAQQYDQANASDYRDFNAAVYIAMGDDYWSEGAYNDAESNYSSAVKLRSTAEHLHKKGMAHVKLEEWERAIIALRKSVEKEENAVAYRDLGNAFYGKAFEDKDEHSPENFKSAVAAYTKAIELDIDFTEMYGWLGLAYVQLARAYDAEQAAEKAEANFVDEAMIARLHYGIADLYRFNKVKKYAKMYYEKVVQNDQAAVNITAYSQFYLGNKKAAYVLLQDNLTEAIDEDEKIAEAYFSLAALYSKDKQLENSLENLSTALEKGFGDFKIIPNEMELSQLHDNPRFTALQKEYGFRVKYIPKHILEQQFLLLNPSKIGVEEE